MIDIVSAAAVNPKVRDEAYRDRLFRSVTASYESMDWARTFFRRMVREYGGPTYGEAEDPRTKYINKISQFVNAYTMILAGNRPQVAIETKYDELIPFAKNWEANINALCEMIDIRTQLQDCAQNSIFFAGFMKVHRADTGRMLTELDVTADPGMPYVTSFTIEDWVHDQSVKRRGKMRWAGNKFRMKTLDLKLAIEAGRANPDSMEWVRATSRMDHEPERADLISIGQDTDDDEIDPSFDAVDIFDYEDQVTRCYALESTRRMTMKGDAIMEIPWDGLTSGPYHIFSLYTVPDNILPKSPLTDLEAMERFINNMARKTARQIQSQKENMVYTPAGKNAADALTNARDRQSVMVTDVRDVDVIRQGGVDPGVTQTLGNFLNLFDEQAGNLKQVLGLGASAETLGQEQIIQQAGTRMGNFLEDRFQTETSKVLENLSRLMWSDMFLEIKSTITVDNTGVTPLQVDSSWVPGDREGSPEQYLFNVVPYSARLRTPAEKIQMITQMMGQVYLPLQEQLMAQGGMIDMFAFTEMLADKMNMPEFRSLITFSGAQMPGPKPPVLSGKPATTNRNYTRTSAPAPGANWDATPVQASTPARNL